MSKRQELLNDAEESLRMAMQAHQSKMWTALPAIVSSVNLEAQTIQCTPAIQVTETDQSGAQTNVTLPELLDVPLCFPRAGGFAMTFPVAIGDEVLVVFSCRAIDSWWASGKIGSQVERRMHDLSDAFAILAPSSQLKKLSNVSSTEVQIRNENSSSIIAIATDGTIKLTAATIEINGDINHTGELTSNGIVYDTHQHSGVQAGGDISGAPVT